jgi:multicomponent Na+:H+ antiporter subunit E
MKKAEDAFPRPKAKERRNYTRLAYLAIEFAILFAFWLVLSGHYQIRYIAMGAFAAGLVTFLTSDLVYPATRLDKGRAIPTSAIFLNWRNFLAYIPWLLYSIVKANIDVALLILNPRLPVAPALLQFRTNLKRNISRVTLANSITLTPGTVTIDLKDGQYVVHALEPRLAGSLLSGQMQNKVAGIFGEQPEAEVSARWASSTEELKP